MNERLSGRIYNWKFASAAGYLTGDLDADLHDTVCALSEMFGNSGWFYGDMGTVINYVVNAMLKELDRKEQRDDRGA